jgi:hypothetical protein
LPNSRLRQDLHEAGCSAQASAEQASGIENPSSHASQARAAGVVAAKMNDDIMTRTSLVRGSIHAQMQGRQMWYRPYEVWGFPGCFQGVEVGLRCGVISRSPRSHAHLLYFCFIRRTVASTRGTLALDAKKMPPNIFIQVTSQASAKR